ncbi:MAG: DegV family protein [Peptococcaceae bacterium]|nr:DegV family protein [Peptococcaceae bacterium]
MQNYVIITDSASDIPAPLVQDFDITLIPLQFTINETDYYDDPLDRKLPPEDFFALMRQGHQAQTAQVTANQFIAVFEPILQRGQDILYLGFSSKISGTYDSSALASQELAAKYPDRTLLTLDTKAASMGLALMVDLAVQQKKKGMSVQELYDWVKAQLPHLCHWFTVDDLVYLRRGGRVSAVASFIGTTLNIKPILHVDNEGALIPVGKVRGRKQSLESLAQKMAASCIDPEQQTVYICHADALQDAQTLEASIKSLIPVREVRLGMMGSTIGAHAGPGTIALFFIGQER